MSAGRSRSPNTSVYYLSASFFHFFVFSVGKFNDFLDLFFNCQFMEKSLEVCHHIQNGLCLLSLLTFANSVTSLKLNVSSPLLVY